MEEIKLNVEQNKSIFSIKNIIFVILIIIVLFLGYSKFANKKQQVTISSKSELVKELEIRKQ